MKVVKEHVIDYDREVDVQFRELLGLISHLPRRDRKEIKRAFAYARKAHEGIRRKSGEPYILHPLAVARIVVEEMGLEDPTSIQCAFLHDVVEDTHIDLDEMEAQFGETVRNIIDGLTKISGSEWNPDMNSKQAENFRKILLTISDDIRVVLIKLADRLHNMRTLGAMKEEKKLKIASETQYIYAPLAHRLGLYEIKTALEDLALKHSQPHTYEEIRQKISDSKAEAQEYINTFIYSIQKILAPTRLKFKVKSRYKAVSSIYNKMIRKNLPFEEVYDRYAIRIILDTRDKKERDDCWHVYSVLSRTYRPNPKRVRDWITVPKANGYESLHTTLLGPEGKWVEVQIRTTRMDVIAEKGIAAHWKYKENGEVQEDYYTTWIGQVREILENPSLNALEALKEFRENLKPEDVFVFTPKGEMIRLPNHSTALDFAYKIHTSIGDTAIGAKINNQVETLSHELRPGDQVEILTSNKQRPQQNWLKFVQTARAKDRIKSALRKERNEVIERGKRMFAWKARGYQVDEQHPYMKELLAYFMFAEPDDLYAALGNHNIDTNRIAEFIKLKKSGKSLDSKFISEWERKRRSKAEKDEDIRVDEAALVVGVERNIGQYVLGHCCNPVFGDTILGYEDADRIVVHRTSCQEATQLMANHGDQIIQTRWTDKLTQETTFVTAIQVIGLDKQGMLMDLIRILTMQMKLNIRRVTIASQDGLFEGLFDFFVHDLQGLNDVIKRIEKLPHVYTVVRYTTNAEPFELKG